MKKKILRKVISAGMALLLTVITCSAAFAADLDTLLKETKGLEEYLKELTTTITTLSLKQEYIQSEIDDTQVRIDENQELLDDAQVACEEQYELMKKRIRYLYESGETNYLEALLSSSSISDILNKFEYIDNIVGYDRDMLDKYKDLVETVQSLNEQLLEKKEELEDLKAKAIENMNEATAVANASTSDIAEYGIDGEEINDVVSQYLEEYGEEIREDLEERIAQMQEEDPTYNWYEDPEVLPTPAYTEPVEEEPQPWSEPEPVYTDPEPTQPETPQEIIIEPEPTTEEWTEPVTEPEPVEEDPADSGYVSDIGYDDAYLIACLCSGEVGYVDYIVQWATADLILNRVEAWEWPNTVYEVLHQGGQFDAVNWWYIPGTGVPSYLYYIQNGPLDSCLAAAYDAMGNRGASHGYKFFCTMWFYEGYPEYFTNTYGEDIGGSWFYNVIY